MDHHTLADGRTVRMGRVRPVHQEDLNSKLRLLTYPDGSQKIVLKLSHYYRAALDDAPPPVQVDYSQKALAAIKQVYLNDQLGDCVIASKMHQVGIWTGNETGSPVIGTDTQAQQTYTSWCGPGDNGCVITNVLDKMQSQGIPVGSGSHKIDGYVALDWTNKQLVQVAIDLFGSVCFGVNLPSAWLGTNILWDVTSTPIIGGHDISGTAYGANLSNALGVPFAQRYPGSDGVAVCSWGGINLMTWAAILKFVEECYVELSPDWYAKGNLAPNGIDVTALRTDLGLLAKGQIPPLSPTPPPSPPPSPPPPVPVPTISINSVSPPSGSIGATVYLTGQGFSPTSKVWFGNTTPASTGYVNSTVLTAVVPTGVSGLVDLRVSDASGTSPVVPQDQFTVTVPVPPSPPPPSPPSPPSPPTPPSQALVDAQLALVACQKVVADLGG